MLGFTTVGFLATGLTAAGTLVEVPTFLVVGFETRLAVVTGLKTVVGPTVIFGSPPVRAALVVVGMDAVGWVLTFSVEGTVPRALVALVLVDVLPAFLGSVLSTPVDCLVSPTRLAPATALSASSLTPAAELRFLSVDKPASSTMANSSGGDPSATGAESPSRSAAWSSPDGDAVRRSCWSVVVTATEPRSPVLPTLDTCWLAEVYVSSPVPVTVTVSATIATKTDAITPEKSRDRTL